MTSADSSDQQDPYRRLRQSLALLAQDGDNSSLRAHVVQTALSTGAIDQAQSVLAAASASAMQDPQLRYALACVHMSLKDYAAAQAELESLLHSGIDNPGVRVTLATCHYLSNRHHDVVALLLPLVTSGNHHAGAARMLVSSLHHVGAVEQAVELANHLQESTAQDAPTAGVFALLYLDADDSQRASHWARVALAGNPDSIDGLIAQATLDAAELHSDAAVPRFRRVLELDPENPRAWIGLGSLSLAEQRFDDARLCFENGLRGLPNHLGTWIVLGWNHMLSDDLAAAERTFRHAMELDRTFGETHGALASVAALQGNFDEAGRLLEVARRLDPDCMGARFAEAVIAGGRGDPEGAREMILRATASLGVHKLLRNRARQNKSSIHH